MAEQRCPRCGSDTCPGIDDVLTCTCFVNGLSAADEARKALLTEADPPLTMLDMLDALAGAADQFAGFARNGHTVDHRAVEFYQRAGRMLRDAHSRLATKRPPARHVEHDRGPRLEGQTGVPVYMTEPDGPRWKFTVYGNDVEVCIERGVLWARVRRRGGERYTTWTRGGESDG